MPGVGDDTAWSACAAITGKRPKKKYPCLQDSQAVFARGRSRNNLQGGPSCHPVPPQLQRSEMVPLQSSRVRQVVLLAALSTMAATEAFRVPLSQPPLLRRSPPAGIARFGAARPPPSSIVVNHFRPQTTTTFLHGSSESAMVGGEERALVVGPLKDILSGVVTALASVPTSIAFAQIAGVNPIVGIWSSVIVGLIMSVFGRTPGLIAGAAGVVAVPLAPLIAAQGVAYMLPTVLLAALLVVLCVATRLSTAIVLVTDNVLKVAGVHLFLLLLRYVPGLKCSTMSCGTLAGLSQWIRMLAHPVAARHLCRALGHRCIQSSARHRRNLLLDHLGAARVVHRHSIVVGRRHPHNGRSGAHRSASPYAGANLWCRSFPRWVRVAAVPVCAGLGASTAFHA